MGGGTAGWMSALLLNQQLSEYGVRVSLMESEQIGTIGVGEGTTPYIRQFFSAIGLSEREWMSECQATFKCGIRFPSWSDNPEHGSYFHPFYSGVDKEPGEAFFVNANLRRRGQMAEAQPDRFFLAHYLASQGKAPKVPDNAFHLDYAYHFDAGLLGQYLKKVGIQRGIRHRLNTIDAVRRHPSGDIASVITADGEAVAADFFIDCTGFASKLLQQNLGVPFCSFADNLLNDSAVAIQLPRDYEQVLVSETRSEALSNGWAWRIPLIRRTGFGYVFSSNYQSPDQAETELRRYLQVGDEIPARRLSMKVGRVEKHWQNNCLAVGLSQGFIEPLEATALMLVQFTVERFARALIKGSPEHCFNQEVNRMFDGVRDYIVAHYKTNGRQDTPYWRDNREQTPASDRLQAILDTWRTGAELEPVLTEMESELVYFRPSWYCLLAGSGLLPDVPAQPCVGTPASYAERFFRPLAERFTDQTDYL
ncbi:tryptophan halogenase family protein [Saliniradius amylolyticus]|uniref:tryptophan halogenase family protein n=1 Tax=Saliniradius amylolyticus TaxID=2183582 RepID=UPI0023B77FDF|nr:tryptophan halogenase family protein [Saliniradius amylolyticus]